MCTKGMDKIQETISAWKPQHNRNQRWQIVPRFLINFFLVYYGRIICPLTYCKLNGGVLYEQRVFQTSVPGCETRKKKAWSLKQHKEITDKQKALFTLLFERTRMSRCTHVLTTTLQVLCAPIRRVMFITRAKTAGFLTALCCCCLTMIFLSFN